MAARVVVWLGDEKDDSSRALEFLESIGSAIEVDWVNYSTRPRILADGKGSKLSDRLELFERCGTAVTALYNLVHREWFERLWIRQEIGLAANAVIGCGFKTIPWETFRNAIFYTYTVRSSFRDHLLRTLGDRGREFQGRLRLLYHVCDHKVYLLDSLREEMVQIKCTDPRDRIYASLSLLHPSHQAMGIIPDYSLTTSRVYEKVVLCFINYWNSLSILFQCELQGGPITMPTWVPDWSSETLANPISGAPSNASAYFEAITEYRGNGILNVAGVLVATISHVRPIQLNDSNGLEATLKSLWDTLHLRNMLHDKTLRNDEHRQLEIFCDTVCCGLFSHTTIPMREDFASFDSSVRLIASLLGLEDQYACRETKAHDKDTWEKYTARLREVCHNRSLFITLQGSIGLAPITARPGDEVCVLLGCDSTILVRPILNHLHQVVGQSYMSGINTGEALLGPLPKNLRAVNYYDSTAQAFYFAYMNDQSGKIEFKDPRLYALSIDLSIHKQLWEKGNFQRIKIGLDTLRKNGINVKTFDLA